MRIKTPIWAVASFFVWLIMLFIGVYFRTSFIRDHQPWMEGVSQLLIGFCWFLPSFSLIVAPGVAIGFVRSISTSGRQWNVEEWKILSNNSKLKIFGIALINLLIGIFLVINGTLIVRGLN